MEPRLKLAAPARRSARSCLVRQPPADLPIRKSTRILHVLGLLGRGGAEMRTLELVRHIDRGRYRCHFCALSGLPGALDGRARALGCQIHYLHQSSLGFPGRFRRLLQAEKFDVVHSHVHYFSGYVLRLAAECGVRVRVAHFRSPECRDLSPWGRRVIKKLISPWCGRYAGEARMRRWVDRYATKILAVSEATMARAWGPDWRTDPRCRVIYNGLECSAFVGRADGDGVRQEFGLPPRAPLCIHVGRIVEEKNHARLVSVFAELRKRRPAARLLLVGRIGTPSAHGNLRRRIAKLRIGDGVVFGGERSDVPRLLKAADVLIFPSFWEGLPGAVLEACAAGTPVVSSDLPGIREIAARLLGVHPLSLELPDEYWAGVIDEILEAPPSDHLRETARRAFQSSAFTIDRCAKRMCRIWEGVASGGPPGDAAYDG